MGRAILLILTLGLAAGFGASAITAEEIVANVERNEINEAERIEGSMTISDRFGSRRKTFVSYASGSDKMLLEFTNPEERGQKILRLEDEIYLYFPEAEEVIHLQGSALKESVMGSDFSYEDMTERATKMREEYTGEIKGEELLNGRNCFVLTLTSKIAKQTYFTRKIWVDKERFIGMKEELYAKSGKLLKVLTVDNIESFKNRYYPTKITMEDKLRKNSSTQMILKKIDFDVTIPPGTFSERRLMKK